MRGVQIRRATPTDLSALLTLVGEFYRADHHHYDEQRVIRALEPLLVDDNYGQVWLFDTGCAVVTWSYSLESGGRDALVDEFYVRNRGRGVGGAVMRALLGKCREAGALKVFLETEEHNDAARRFYRRHGFEVERSTWLSREL
ncbi:GNAT family N-acetyltransferase [Saccharothrix coeruleofusca]|uniref:N-acetyltransferase domain-containing protein n=1 Tax=Saccharothrix coeruleofusca TaxID=33919 RepID=A0A918EBA7_9PSEU|nr:GNAT family N-acetyltransferase [Saccharothrix coeruleofusca]GGP40550.1 hypothetical protein GCM10010185_09510 [Saccharothrix coeruleofusca]